MSKEGGLEGQPVCALQSKHFLFLVTVSLQNCNDFTGIKRSAVCKTTSSDTAHISLESCEIKSRDRKSTTKSGILNGSLLAVSQA